MKDLLKIFMDISIKRDKRNEITKEVLKRLKGLKDSEEIL